MKDIYDHYQRMNHSNIILAYNGSVSDELFDSILQLAENKLDKLDLETKIRKKIFSILVEILQNVYHHFEEEGKREPEQSIIFLIYKEAYGYRVISGNPILNNEVGGLKERIDVINNMSNEEIKSIYRDRLSHGELSPKGGAGLGMLDIVRKSGDKIDYDFRKIDDLYSFFSLEIKISA